MTESKSNLCESHLIKVWMPISKPYLKATIKSIVPLEVPYVEGRADFLFIDPICRISGSRYLINLSFDDESHILAVELDISTMATKPIEDLSSEILHSPYYMLSRNDYIMYVSSSPDGISILKDGKLQYNIDFKPRYRYGKSFFSLLGRWNQQFNDQVYMIDHRDHLYRIFWTDIVQSVSVIPELIGSQVEDFCVSKKGMAIIYKNGDFKLPGEIMVKSERFPADVRWSIVVRASHRWIISGDHIGNAVMMALSEKGYMQSSLTVKLNHSGYKPEQHAVLYCLKVAVERRRCCLILAFGIDGCCHLISMTRSGYLILIESIDSMLDANVQYEDDSCKTTFSVTETDIEGQYIMTSYKQINMISLKFK